MAGDKPKVAGDRDAYRMVFANRKQDFSSSSIAVDDDELKEKKSRFFSRTRAILETVSSPRME